jgi:hypothetical protein
VAILQARRAVGSADKLLGELDIRERAAARAFAAWYSRIPDESWEDVDPVQAFLAGWRAGRRHKPRTKAALAP